MRYYSIEELKDFEQSEQKPKWWQWLGLFLLADIVVAFLWGFLILWLSL